jgi:hypothetical protein
MTFLITALAFIGFSMWRDPDLMNPLRHYDYNPAGWSFVAYPAVFIAGALVLVATIVGFLSRLLWKVIRRRRLA